MPLPSEYHKLTLSMTNSHGYVPVCACGWIGNVHSSPPTHDKHGKVKGHDYEKGMAGAGTEHQRHVLDVILLYGVPTAENFVGAVINTKRFGHA